MLHPHPTRQNRTVKHWLTPTIKLTMNAPIRAFPEAVCENLGCPMQRLNNPLKIVPAILILKKKKINQDITRFDKILTSLTISLSVKCVSHIPEPGKKMLKNRQNQAQNTGRHGIAPRIRELCSTRTSGIFDLGSLKQIHVSIEYAKIKFTKQINCSILVFLGI